MLARASLATFLPAYSLRFDLFLETIDAIAHATAIRFEFRFTRTTTTDAAGESGERRILTSNQTWQQVLQLRQLNLSFSFTRVCALRGDIEDQLRTIDDLQVCRLRQRTHLRSRQLAIEDEHVSAELQGADDQFIEFAAPEDSARIDLRATLNNSILDHDARGRC